VEHDAAGHFCGAHEHETHSLGHEDGGLDELAQNKRRCDHLKGQSENVQHVGQQPGVIVLLEFHVHPFGWDVVAAVVSVGLAQADSEPLGLVQLGGGQQEQHSSVDTGFGPPAAHVAGERLPIDVMFRADRVSFQACEEFLSAGQPPIQ
jgi:hypothetical protein